MHPAAADLVGIGWRAPHAAELLARRPALGFIEVHSENFFGDGGPALAELQRARAHWPVSLHGVGLALGSAAGLDPWHLDRLAALVARVDPVRVSDHASFARVAAPGRLGVHHAADLLPISFSRISLGIMARHVQQVQDRLGRRLWVENLSACLRSDGDEMAEPEFFNALARQTGCGLLLDVNNLVVNALNEQAADPVAQACRWVDAIALGIVGEIHLAGHDDHGPLVIDDHGSPVPESVWQVYRHALDRLGPVPTLIEWDSHLPPLETLLAQADRARQCQAEWATAPGRFDRTPPAALKEAA